MRLIHLSDLHLGKRVNEFSMLEDQRYILAQILQIIEKEQADAVIVAGDIFDRSVPGEDAVRLWDDFLRQLAGRRLQVFAISGNHDSAVRFAVHSQLIDNTGVHLAPAYGGHIDPYTLEDDFGKVNIYMLPFIKPAHVRNFFPEEEIRDYSSACAMAIKQMGLDVKERNILLAHQFVMGAKTCDSEEIVVGGLDQIDVSVFDDFDYVALGHIHSPQKVGRESVRYCGTPLKYSFSEINHEKSVTIVEMGEKGDVGIRTEELKPLHDMRLIRGTYEELSCRENYESTEVEDYIYAELTDEEDIPDAMAKLRLIYPNLMKLSYDNTRTRENRLVSDSVDVENKSPLELLEEFYETQNNQPMNEEQRSFARELIRTIWEVN